MTRRLMWMVALAALAAPAARAQDHKVELSGTAGWVFSDGVSEAARTRARGLKSRALC